MFKLQTQPLGSRCLQLDELRPARSLKPAEAANSEDHALCHFKPAAQSI